MIQQNTFLLNNVRKIDYHQPMIQIEKSFKATTKAVLKLATKMNLFSKLTRTFLSLIDLWEEDQLRRLYSGQQDGLRKLNCYLLSFR